jgi:hypothetical protein
MGLETVDGKLRREGVAAEHDDQLRRQDQPDQRADRRILQGAALQFGEIDVEHHDDEQEQNHHRADIDDEQDHRQELGPGQHEQAGGVEEGQDQEQHRMHGVARRNDHERRRHRDKGEEVEKGRL